VPIYDLNLLRKNTISHPDFNLLSRTFLSHKFPLMEFVCRLLHMVLLAKIRTLVRRVMVVSDFLLELIHVGDDKTYLRC
jgi:hypothetical protein